MTAYFSIRHSFYFQQNCRKLFCPLRKNMRVEKSLSVHWLSYYFTALLVCARGMDGFTTRKMTVEIVTVGNIYPNVPGAIPFTGPGIESAVDELNCRYKGIFQVTHTYLSDHRYPNCVELATGSDALLGKWYYNPERQRLSMTVFIFAGCLEAYPTNRLVAGWNILMITSAVNGAILRNKQLSPTWITGSCVSLVNYLKLFSNLFTKFKWSSFYVIGDYSANPVYLDLHPSLVRQISLMNGSQLTTSWINSAHPEKTDFRAILTDFRMISRVIIFLGHGGPLRQLMLTAADLSMTDGEYTYIAMEIFENPMFGAFTWRYGDQDDDKAKEAFRSVLLLGPDPSIYDAPYSHLISEWKARSAAEFNVTYTELNPYVMSSYSSVMMFGKVLNQTLSDDPSFDLTNGREFTRYFLNRTFELGYTEVYIDEAGERRTDLVVRDLNYSSGDFVTSLMQGKARSILREIREIDWASDDNAPPSNEPTCGYRGTRRSCLQTGNVTTTFAAAITSACLVVILGLIIGVLLHRKYGARHWERDLWWYLNPDTLEANALNTTYLIAYKTLMLPRKLSLF